MISVFRLSGYYYWFNFVDFFFSFFKKTCLLKLVPEGCAVLGIHFLELEPMHNSYVLYVKIKNNVALFKGLPSVKQTRKKQKQI